MLLGQRVGFVNGALKFFQFSRRKSRRPEVLQALIPCLQIIARGGLALGTRGSSGVVALVRIQIHIQLFTGAEGNVL